MSEKPEHQRPRRLANWINPTGAKKVHSLIDKVYKRKNLEMAWEKVKANKGAGGIDGESIEAFGSRLQERLGQLHEDLKTDRYRPLTGAAETDPEGRTTERTQNARDTRDLSIGCVSRHWSIGCKPIFEPVFDDANFGYRRGLSTKDALRKLWKEIEAGWGVDRGRGPEGLLRVGRSIEKLLTLVAQRVSDGRVLRLIEAMLKAGS